MIGVGKVPMQEEHKEALEHNTYLDKKLLS